MTTASIRHPAKTEHRSRLGWVVLAVGVLVIGWLVASRITTSAMWYSSVGVRSVYVTRLVTSLLLFLVFALVMGVSVALTVMVAHRMRPKVRTPAASPVLARYRELIEQRWWTTSLLPAGVLGLLAGLAAADQTDRYLAWRNATDFGTRDPYSGLDASFFVFALPWWMFVVGFVIAVLVACLVVAGVTHLANGALRAMAPRLGGRPGTRQASSPFDSPAQAHLSLLMAALLVAYGGLQLLERFTYQVSPNYLFTGVGYADAHARITGKLVMAVVSFLCAAGLVVNAKLRRWPLVGSTLVVMLVTSIVVQGIYPAALQRLSVRPSYQSKEYDYVAANIKATRDAYGIAGTEITDYPAVTTATAGQLRQDAEALPSIRLMDPAVISAAFEQQQQVRGYYSFPSELDVDRYTLDGQTTDAVVAAREVDVDKLADKSWNNLHTVYTHGYGLVAAYGNQRELNGEPVWLEGDLPSRGKLGVEQPRIYFGEESSQYVVVGAPSGTAPVELDLPTSGDLGKDQKVTYSGAGGVSLRNWLVRLMFATTNVDANLLLSNQVNADSKILFDREPRVRVQQVAPWLTVDQDPYPTVVNGRVVWVVDGYTTSDSYPNSQRVDLRAATTDSQSIGVAQKNVNYLRNSVKAVVDAYDGTVTLYAWDETDPILQTEMKVYPGVVKPKSAIPSALLSHLRYPQDLFKVQRQVLGKYHTTNPLTLMQNSDLWRVPADPTQSGGKLEPPYYLTIKWPGDSSPVFSQTSVFVPDKRENLRSYMAVNADATSADYGKIRILRMDDSQQIPGPSQTMNAITTNTVVAEKLRPFLNQGSAQAIFGNLLTLPLGGGLLYVQPIYTQRQSSANGGYPALQFVVVRFGEHVGIGDTLQEALDAVFGGDAGGQTEEKPTSPTTNPTTNPTAAKLLAEAQAAFTAADSALKQGNLAEYQKQLTIARTKVEEALKVVK
ncbi:UPF0182 family membrane protein [Aestuariimicrobium sp. T2.26MG-19.2B]|uniref:UPF0182 family membrane protein n=1 Tax=Aestuariimicrobium sp. T2.26MG-19.2B TaxID=3040679 RepID=UPI0024779172|nr:UPF0182 family protein [Aestuariimicrobium sp. T2.26MG-19.2B]CAI9410660.1 hypothetical protein AESSP_02485 [Aestuariimicrobium sp. T2.26MG-19.2B]